eukprot:6176928-Pleurochrysis_carterae.AAC.1
MDDSRGEDAETACRRYKQHQKGAAHADNPVVLYRAARAAADSDARAGSYMGHADGELKADAGAVAAPRDLLVHAAAAAMRACTRPDMRAWLPSSDAAGRRLQLPGLED